MDDLISRQAAIDFIDAGHLVNPNEPRWSDNEVVNFLRKRPSADVPHWIPCSEQMPPMDKYVLVCTVDGDITDGQRWDEDDDGTWFIFGDSHSASDDDIVAWMPLPEPYEEGEINEQ